MHGNFWHSEVGRSMSDMSEEAGQKISNAISAHWNTETSKKSSRRTRWWQIPSIVRHINSRVCGSPVDGLSQGLNELVRSRIPLHSTFAKGISIGCGNGLKELNLVRQKLVEHFDLYELSQLRIDEGLSLARKWNLETKVAFHNSDGFECSSPESYDFVHWNNSLHHMLDVESAVCWSHKVLNQGGMFYMDDFIGPRRFQWTDNSLEVVAQIRRILPEKYLVNPDRENELFPIRRRRPDPAKLKDSDPSEAADSDKILPSVAKIFPQAQVILTGGVVYHLALSDIVANFDEDNDHILLDLLMLVDDLLSSQGENLYAVAIAIKE